MHRTVNKGIRQGAARPKRRVDARPDRAGGSVRSALALALVGALTLAVSASTTCVLTAGLGAPRAAAATTTPVNTMYVLNNTSGSVLSFAPGATGNVAPTSTVSGPSTTLNSPYYMAMDPSGNVWVANYAANTVVELTQSQLAVGGSPAPTVTLTSTVSNSLDHPTYVLFDRSGDLWVTNAAPGNGSVVEFTPSQLSTTGSPTPTVTLTDDGVGSISDPRSMAFDGQGGLWVGNDGTNTLVRFTPAQISATGAPTPGVTLTSTGTSIATPDALAFDGSGQLWVADDTTPGSLVAFSPAQLASSGAPVPHITLSPNGTSLDAPDGLTFDPFGNLWVANFTGQSITEFLPSQLATTGTPAATSTLTGSNTTLSGPDNVLFVPSTGYTLAATDGGIFNYGGSGFFGSTGSLHLNSPVVGMAGTPDGLGYWLVAGDGGIFNFGNAPFRGSAGSIPLNKPVVGMAATPDGQGYWLVASDGGIFTYGSATFYGGHGGSPLNKPIVGMAATPDGGGYWLVASDGGIFTYGDAAFFGSHGGSPLNKPIIGMAASPDGGGYWLVASDGGIFNYGDAGFYGSAGAIPLNKPIVGLAATPDGGGYWLVASDGGIFTYGNAAFSGSHGGSPLNKPIVAMAGPHR
jgi:sugar lactone lactonase YvrE